MKKIILGSDWWSDCDDVVAVRLLARAVKNGDAELLGIILNACKEDSVASLDGFLETEGLSGVPIGIDFSATDFSRPGTYQAQLVPYARTYKSNSDAEDGVRLYRRLLRDADEAVTLVEIGYYQVVADLLQSGPDDISDLTGAELVGEKVKEIYAMAGRWDVECGHENNFDRGPRAMYGASLFLKMCPVPITFLGFEIGFDVISGSELLPNDVLHLVLREHGSPRGRSSWDPMTVLLALAEDARSAGYETVRGTAFVDAKSGTNTFEKSDMGRHFYVKRLCPPEHYARLIDERIKTIR